MRTTTARRVTVGIVLVAQVRGNDGISTTARAEDNAAPGFHDSESATPVGLTVTDPDSVWTQDGALSVGWTARGVLTIENGGRVECAEGVIARSPGSTGDVTMAGFGSTWSIDGVLTVGGLLDTPGGTGMLSVEDQSMLYVGDMLKVWPESTVNLADVDITVDGGVWLSGTLSGSGSIDGHLENDGGLVSPGTSTGVIFVGGDYTQHSGGALHIQIDGPIAGDDFGQLAVTGMASLGGMLEVSFTNEFTPQMGDRFDILTFGDVFRDFETVQLPDDTGDIHYCVTMVDNAVMFLATVPPDFTCDGFVDLDDFGFFSDCLRGPSLEMWAGCEQTDLTGDGHVDLADFGEFRRSFGWPDQ